MPNGLARNCLCKIAILPLFHAVHCPPEYHLHNKKPWTGLQVELKKPGYSKLMEHKYKEIFICEVQVLSEFTAYKRACAGTGVYV